MQFARLVVLALLAAMAKSTFAQSIIAKQDFESTPGTPTMTFSTSDTGSPGASSGFSSGTSGSSTSNAPANVNLFTDGARGYRLQGPSSGTASRALTFSTVNTASYTSVSLSFRIAGMSLGSNANGVESGDEVLVEVSPDGGTTYYQQAKVVVSPNSNVRWSFGATGAGSRAYQADNSFSNFTTTGSGTITSGATAITTATITDLPAVASLKIRITLTCNSTNESWIMDQVELSGTPVSGANPTLTTPTSASVTASSATLGATITSDGGSSIMERGTVYSTSSPVASSNNPLAEGGTSTSAFSHSRTGLNPETQYFYAGYAINGTGTGLSPEGNFRTLSSPPTAAASGLTATGAPASASLSWSAASYPGSGATQYGYLVLYSTGTPSMVASPNGLAPASALSGGTSLGANLTSVAPTLPANSTTVTGLSSGTSYNFTVIPYTWDGTNAATYNYLTSGAPTASATPTFVIYNYIGTGTGSWATASNWSPTGVPASNDGVVFATGTAVTVTNVPTIALAGFSINSSTQVTFNAAGTVTVSVGTGASGTDFSVESGSTLTLAGSNAITINILTGNTGSVAGDITAQQGAHRLTAADASGLTFASGGSFTAGNLNVGQTGYSGAPFGSSGTASTVIFESGSSYVQKEGSNPFQLAQPASKVVFQSGSEYYFAAGTGTPSLSGRTYAHFFIENNSAVAASAASNWTMENLSIESGSSLTFTGSSTNTVTIKGNVSADGNLSISAGSGGVQFNNPGSFDISGAATTCSFNNVTIAASTTITLFRNITITTLLTVNGTLDLADGVVTTGTGKVSIASTASLLNNTGYVHGNLERHIPTGTGISSFFPLGDGSAYAPLTVDFENVTTTGTLLGFTTAGDHPSIASSTFDPSKTVNRYWTLANTATVFDEYSLSVVWDAADLDAGVNTSEIYGGKYSSTTWSYPEAGGQTPTSAALQGLTTFSDFQFGECTAPTTYYADADADGYGDDLASTAVCFVPAAHATSGGDCDDADPDINPGETENCLTSADENCNGGGNIGSMLLELTPDCIGDALNMVEVSSVSGGLAPLSYSMDGLTYQDTIRFDSLAPGAFTFRVKDADNCEVTEDLNIEPHMVGNGVSTPVSCFGGNNGTATGTLVSGGYAPYTYEFFENTTLHSTGTIEIGVPVVVTDLRAGSKKFFVTDSYGCRRPLPGGPVTQPARLVVSFVKTNISCNGANNGTATANVTGGTGMKTYLWSTGATTATATNLTPGRHYVSVTDANSCLAIDSVTITQPSAITATISRTNVTCFGGSNGSAKVTPYGGTGTKTLLWSTGATTNTISGLGAGTYYVSITDANGCLKIDSAVVIQPTQVAVALTVVQPSCAGSNNGSITANATGGTGAKTYLWNTGSTAKSLVNLMPGTYSVTATDSKMCQNSASAVITDPQLLNIDSIRSVPGTMAGRHNVTIYASGGTGTKRYRRSTPGGPYTSPVTSSTFFNLIPSTYTFVVLDTKNCTDSMAQAVPVPPPPMARPVAGAILANGPIGERTEPSFDFELAPNPTADFARLVCADELPAGAMLEVQDATGRLIRRQSLESLAAVGFRFSVADLPGGVVSLTLRAAGFAPSSRKLVVLKN